MDADLRVSVVLKYKTNTVQPKQQKECIILFSECLWVSMECY